MSEQPILNDQNIVKIYPENPHYLMFKGSPLLLITSAEHYGAVINQDFDYRAYLAALAAYGLNYTRIYPGAYVEVEGMFIENNTLAPRMGSHLVPWARSAIPGCWDGRNKYDLHSWSQEYFMRLRDFIRTAARHDIVVEICFFNCQYTESWHACALNAANNIQGIGCDDFCDFQTLKSPALVQEQGRYIDKIIKEVNEFDNVILEICDEPTMKGTPATLAVEWVDRMIQFAVEAQKDLPRKHLIAQQYMIGIDFTADPRVPIITAQYIRQCAQQIGGVEALDTVYHLNKPIELNETAYYPIWYEGDVEAASRAEAWEFIVGGGAAFNHLNGRFCVPDPGGATPDNHNVMGALRSLKAFMDGHAYPQMSRDTSFVTSELAPGALARGMSQPGKQYILYIHHSTMKESGTFLVANPGAYQEELRIALPSGRYLAKWILPEKNETLESIEFSPQNGTKFLQSPPYSFDIALSIQSAGD